MSFSWLYYYWHWGIVIESYDWPLGRTSIFALYMKFPAKGFQHKEEMNSTSLLILFYMPYIPFHFRLIIIYIFADWHIILSIVALPFLLPYYLSRWYIFSNRHKVNTSRLPLLPSSQCMHAYGRLEAGFRAELLLCLRLYIGRQTSHHIRRRYCWAHCHIASHHAAQRRLSPAHRNAKRRYYAQIRRLAVFISSFFSLPLSPHFESDRSMV